MRRAPPATRRRALPRPREHAGVAVQVSQGDQLTTYGRRDVRGVELRAQAARVLHQQTLEHARLERGREGRFRAHRVEQAHVTEFQRDVGHRRLGQDLEQQRDDFGVAFDSCMPVELRADLQRVARTGELVRHGVHDRADITEALWCLCRQAVGVDARDLRRHVRAHAHQTPGDLVDELERLQIEVFAVTRQQGVEVLDDRRDDQFVAPPIEYIENAPPEFFERAGLGRQDFVDAVRQ